MAPALHRRRAVLSRHRALLHRSDKHLRRDNSARPRVRLRLRGARRRTVGDFLGLPLDSTRRRMDGRSLRRASRAGGGRRGLVARYLHHAAGRGREFLGAARDARAPRPWRGSQFSLDTQSDRALGATVRACASAFGELQRDVRRHDTRAERESAYHSRLRLAGAVLHLGRARRGLGRGLDVRRG